VAVKIKLKRMGKIRSPHYRIVVADSRTKRDGRAIEEIGLYNPKLEPSLIQVDSERAQYWLGVGAQPTEPVLAILKVTGDWQKHKGLPGAEGTLKVAEPKAEKRAAFDAALAEVHGEPKSDATTPKKKPAKKSTAKKAEAAPAEAEAKADEAPAAEAAAEASAAEAPKAEAPAEEPKAEEPKAEPKADDAPADEAKADES
jgi:small subunit ribosomal protein S16